MPKTHLNPPELFPSLRSGFSQIVVASGSKTVYLSGQVAWDANRNLVGGSDLGAQAKQAFHNVKTAVEAAGGTVDDVVSLRIYIVNHRAEALEAVGKALRECFPGNNPPASTWLGIMALALPEFLIEVEAIAVLE
ncbi:MAG: RidA family protein [Blastocatellia bacterium]|nr:RidA family protein [Blastocatellia bacterium]